MSLTSAPLADGRSRAAAMAELVRHRGPDGSGVWTSDRGSVAFAHRRLGVIDLGPGGAQPMVRPAAGLAIVHNGEIYNSVELRRELAGSWSFAGRSDTEAILAAYARWGDDCLHRLRGMFAFALWDERRQRLLCARDRFGIKPLLWAEVDGELLVASEAKALLPQLPGIETDPEALAEYLTFQYTLGDRTLFSGVRQLLPGHALVVERGRIDVRRYWELRHDIDAERHAGYFPQRLRELVDDSVAVHLRSDVPVGATLSGGLDSSLIATLAGRHHGPGLPTFHGKFEAHPGYDESEWARAAADPIAGTLHEVDITAGDFRDHIEDVLYHLDYPVAGPGAFPQFMVAERASRQVKVLLGGQGGDELFGGYARYLLAYFEQCIAAAIEGTYQSGQYVVTLESILPNLGALREYRPLIQEFWRDGLFGPLDERYLRLIDRSTDMAGEVDWAALPMAGVKDRFRARFAGGRLGKQAYFDRMTRFDFDWLLPALLHVDDRMSMAHGVETRTPLLDHPVVAFAATVPADVKFEGGQAKRLLKAAFADVLPETVRDRRDKMGFPVPLQAWFTGELRDLVEDTFGSRCARERDYVSADAVLRGFAATGTYSRKLWALLSLELWQRLFHDRAAQWRSRRVAAETAVA